MTAVQDNPSPLQVTPTSNPSPVAPRAHAMSQASSSPSPNKKPTSPREAILSVAKAVAAQPLPCSDDDVWGVLTAISHLARKRSQGINILLTADEHCIGRVADDARFQIESTAVSQRHCAIFRKKVSKEDVESPSSFCKRTFLKDTSTNGTYLNWERLKRGSPKFELPLQHGDMVSFAAPPQHEQAFAFVYREVQSSGPSSNGATLKRKAEDISPDNKRLRGIGIGAPEGPVSLDDFRSLERSNKELRKQLETKDHDIESLRKEKREALERHQNEVKELEESISKSYHDKLNGLNEALEGTKKELTDVNKTAAEQKHAIEDLNKRLCAALQSCTDANELIESQKASVAELDKQLVEEREQRKNERVKAAADLEASEARVQLAQEELQREKKAALSRENEQEKIINNLRESERKALSSAETWRMKSEETKVNLAHSDTEVLQLRAKVAEQEKASCLREKRLEELEIEIKRMKRELDKEKEAREEAWAKVSQLELEISEAMRDLEYERRRLRGARERIMLRETQLRAFYSTTEEIKTLFEKQQEQLKSMQKTLEDEENYNSTSLDAFLNEGADDANTGRKVATGYKSNNVAKAGPSTSAQRFERGSTAETSSEEGSATVKHDCDIRSQDDENTQEAEFPNEDCLVKAGFGSDIDLVGTAPICEGDVEGTERVPETESPGFDGEKNPDLCKSGNFGGDTMQLEDDINLPETEQQVLLGHEDNTSKSQASDRDKEVNVIEDTEPGGGIRTQDLLTSEVAGSWAMNTGPSFCGDNESPHRDNDSACNNERDTRQGMNDSNTQVSQSTPSGGLGTRMHPDHERQALSDMIGIMAPDVKHQFGSVVGNSSQDKSTKVSDSDSDTDDECVEASKNEDDGDGSSGSDEETQAADKNEEDYNEMEVDDDGTQEDSVG